MANPTVIFENFYSLSTSTFTLPAGGEASGFEKEKALDWRLNTVDRWKASGTAADPVFHVDLGDGNDLEAQALVIAGHNLGTITGTGASAVTYKVESSANDSAWVEEVAATAFTDDMPMLKVFDSAGADRYWRVTIGSQPFSAAPQIGSITLGRRLDFEVGANAGLDPYGFTVNVEGLKNNNGSPLGVNVVSREKTFSISYGGDDPGMSVTGFWDASSGLNVDDDFAPHVNGDNGSSDPFWFAWNTDVDSRVWLCRCYDWQNRFVDTTTRRGWDAEFMAYRETS